MARIDLLGGDGGDSYDGRPQRQAEAQSYAPPAMPRISGAPVSAQPYQPAAPMSYPTPGSTIFQSPAGYKGPDYSGFSGSYGGAPGQFNFSGPTRPQMPTANAPQTAQTGTPFDINAFSQGWLGSGGRTLQDWQAYVQAHPLGSGYSLSGSKGDKVVGPNGQGWDAVIASGMGGQGASWQPFGSGASGGNGNVFTDPATSQWESMLRTLSDRLNQPATPQDFAPLTDYLRKYFQELQGPAYTPAQSDLLQTQAIDPLTRQRDAARQQTMQRLSARGIDPRSGVAESALRDVDRQYEQMATQQRSGFAANAVGLEKQQHQQAAGVGNALNQLENAKTQQDEQRALQALNLMFQIPQLADSRLKTAQGSLQTTNPAQLLSMYPQFGQLGMQQSGQDAQYWAQIGQMLAQVFGR